MVLFIRYHEEDASDLRDPREDEIEGLDITEHGLPQRISPESQCFPLYDQYAGDELPPRVIVAIRLLPRFPLRLKKCPRLRRMLPAKADGQKITKVEIVCKESRLESPQRCNGRHWHHGYDRKPRNGLRRSEGSSLNITAALSVETSLLPKIQVDIVVSKGSCRRLL